MLAMAIPVEFATLTITNLTVLLYLGLFQVSLAYVFLIRSLREVPGLEAANSAPD